MSKNEVIAFEFYEFTDYSDFIMGFSDDPGFKVETIILHTEDIRKYPVFSFRNLFLPNRTYTRYTGAVVCSEQ